MASSPSQRVPGPVEIYALRANCRRPVSPSRWSGQAQTRHQRSPDGLNHLPVHEGTSKH